VLGIPSNPVWSDPFLWINTLIPIQSQYTTDLDSASRLKSVTQENDLDEFLNTARLAGTEFTAEKQNVTVVQPAGPRDMTQNRFLLSPQEELHLLKRHAENKDQLRVPRRPPWSKSMTVDELERSERDAFLEWRRQLARLQEEEDLVLTPFERNLEVWRQLWRVAEKSDLVVQIVDGRNPLRFWCEDLDRYVRELDIDGSKSVSATPKRTTILLINKADLLTGLQRQLWADYFDSRQITYAFYSAFQAVAQQAVTDHTTSIDDPSPEGESRQAEFVNVPVNATQQASSPFGLNELDELKDDRTKVLSVLELEALFRKNVTPTHGEGKPLTVGLVGYPNVGKSSTINSLVGAKKVSVSSTPGKTKHFQTIHLSPELVICDCPGLVFPQFAATKADLVCDGVLPIDQLREYTGPASLVVQRVPKDILELTYGIIIPGHGESVTAEGLLISYAVARGFVRSGQGNPDESRAARYILKDYVNAKLLYSHPPPGVSAKSFNSHMQNVLLEHLNAAGKKKAPVTRVPQKADTFIPVRSSDDTEVGGVDSDAVAAVDSNFFRPDPVLSSRPFIQGSKLHGLPFSRSLAFPHQRVSAQDGTALEQQAAHAVIGGDKKHHKGMKRGKQRSGKGYE